MDPGIPVCRQCGKTDEIEKKRTSYSRGYAPYFYCRRCDRVLDSPEAETPMLPCPFCKSSDAEIIETPSGRAFAVCLDCRARTAETSTRAKALHLWNRRS